MKYANQEDGFKVIPVSKNYKFNLKPKHRILSTDEAEERMRQGGTHRPTDRWMMHQKEDGGVNYLF